jgi:molecular chaperone GrpE
MAPTPENDAVTENPSDDALSGDVAELTDLLQRLQADFDNYRKRSRSENGLAREHATSALVKSLLPALDALDAMVSSPQATPGAALTHRLFTQALSAAGLRRIEETGVVFDPGVHEPVNAGVHNVVTKVLRPGYQLGTSLLRPATVELD